MIFESLFYAINSISSASKESKSGLIFDANYEMNYINFNNVIQF